MLLETRLRNCYGAEVSLGDFQSYDYLVVAFLGVDCPLANRYARELTALAEEHSQRVAFVAVDANEQDSLIELQRFFEKHRLNFPLLADRGAVLADRLGATRTPEVFLLDAKREVRYSGRVDDRHGIGFQRGEPRRRDLAIAIDELLAGRDVSLPATPAIGCLIGRAVGREPTGDITYHGQIATIFQRSCLECHRRGQLAPFPLATYEDALGWGPTIVEAIEQGRMPPWFADSKHGQFENDRRLSDAERKLIRQWVENGMPAGQPSGENEERSATMSDDSWRMPQPDEVIYFHDAPFAVPATGPIDYQYVEIPTNWDTEKYVCAAEIRPGNPEVVHHVVVYCWADEGLRQTLAVYSPGCPPIILPAGHGQSCDADSTLRVVIHYTPTGQPETDRSYLGLRFIERPDVRYLVNNDCAVNYDFAIPAGAKAHRVTAETIMPRDCTLLSMMPHMHLRGAGFRFEVEYPSGERELLLDVPRYDFNWQLSYVLKQAKPLPATARLICTATYDNSEGNPANPDPKAEVRFGQSTSEEMMFGLYSIATPLTSFDPPPIVERRPVAMLVDPASLAAGAILSCAVLLLGWRWRRRRMVSKPSV